MALTTSEKQLSNRILSQMDSEKRRRVRKLTDTLEETGEAQKTPGIDYKIRIYSPTTVGALSNGASQATAVGTAGVVTVGTTNRLTRAGVASYSGSAATNSIGGFYFATGGNGADTFLGPSSEGQGFIYKSVFGGVGFTVSTARMFMGYCSQSSAFTDVDPSTLTNIIGVGFDASDTEVQLIHNDGSGTATKVSLGASFPKPTADLSNMYSLRLESSADGTSVSYVVEDLITGVSASGVISTDLPSNTTILGFGGYVSAGGTSTTSRLRIAGLTEIQPNIW